MVFGMVLVIVFGHGVGHCGNHWIWQCNAGFCSFVFYCFHSEIRNPQSAIRNPQSAIRNPQSEIRNPQSTTRNPLLILLEVLQEFHAVCNRHVYVGFDFEALWKVGLLALVVESFEDGDGLLAVGEDLLCDLVYFFF